MYKSLFQAVFQWVHFCQCFLFRASRGWEMRGKRNKIYSARDLLWEFQQVLCWSERKVFMIFKLNFFVCVCVHFCGLKSVPAALEGCFMTFLILLCIWSSQNHRMSLPHNYAAVHIKEDIFLCHLQLIILSLNRRKREKIMGRIFHLFSLWYDICLF